MYQINEIEGKRLINGYEIQVIGNGQRGLCRVSTETASRSTTVLRRMR